MRPWTSRTDPRRGPGGGSRGAVAVLMCAATFLMMTGALAIADAGSMLLARSRAQAAADSAALAAVVRQIPLLGQEGAPDAAAREAASGNGARMVSCACRTGSSTATVTVEVQPRIGLIAAWRGRWVKAEATAKIDDYILTYHQ